MVAAATAIYPPQRIGPMVYELYELTDDESRIVEEATQRSVP